MDTTNANTTMEADTPTKRILVVATRMHLGKASSPPDQQFLDKAVSSFLKLATMCGASRAAIAVDPAPKIEGYDLPAAIRSARDRAASAWNDGGAENEQCVKPAVTLDVVSVTPWGHFVPALNALVRWAASAGASHCLFCSAETNITPDSIESLCSHVELDSTLVAGAALPGHDYRGDGKEHKKVELNGRTTPWNTLSVWNVPKLALAGFPLVADGLHLNEDGSEGPAGVEEASAIAVFQRILPEGTATAKLVKVSDVHWDQEWPDEERRKWHEQKMKSKLTRATRHLQLLGLGGWVVHC